MELEGKKVAVIVARDFEDSEALYPILRLREAGAEVIVAGVGEQETLHGKHGYPLEVDARVEDLRADDLDAVVLPGGYSPDHVRRSEAALDLVRQVHDQGRPVAAICHAGWVLASAGIAAGRELTSWSSIRDDMENAGARWRDAEVVVDGNLITSRRPEDLGAFMREVIGALREAPVKARPPRALERSRRAAALEEGGRVRRRPRARSR